MLFSKVEDCHNLGKIRLVCDYRLPLCVLCRAENCQRRLENYRLPPRPASLCGQEGRGPQQCMVGVSQITCWKAVLQERKGCLWFQWKSWGESGTAFSG